MENPNKLSIITWTWLPASVRNHLSALFGWGDCPSSLNRPQTIPHLHLTNQQGSTLWQVDTWGMVLFWKNSNLQICAMSLSIIPPNWCRNGSSIEDCSLIWCDSIVRSSKKAFGSFHGHGWWGTGWSIWMALTYLDSLGASCSSHQLVVATKKKTWKL